MTIILITMLIPAYIKGEFGINVIVEANTNLRTTNKNGWIKQLLLLMFKFIYKELNLYLIVN